MPGAIRATQTTGEYKMKTKTQALTLARRSVSKPFGYGTSWTIVFPVRASDLSGTTTEAHADNYHKALAVRRAVVLGLTLEIMGYERCEAQDAVRVVQGEHYYYGRSSSVDELLIDAVEYLNV
jgi:hypothetical protein